MLKSIQNYCNQLIKEFDLIGSDRKGILKKLAEYIQAKKSKNEAVNLIYICTHNSRRSHFGQVWASVAANYYLIDQVSAFSGGTEATAFNKNAIGLSKMLIQVRETFAQELSELHLQQWHKSLLGNKKNIHAQQ